MEHLLAAEAEAKYALPGTDRSYELSLKKELFRILEYAEYWYGPRISAYEVHEPLFTECFTGHVVVYPFWFARIYLSNDCKADRFLASYALAHEAIHVLAPAYAVAPTVLEEGLATYFSLKYMKLVYGRTWQSSSDPKYDAAMQAVSKLLAKNAFVIKELRAREPVLSKIDERLLVEMAGTERSLAKFLSSDFQSYWQTPSPWSERTAGGAKLFVDGFRSLWEQWKSA